MAVALDPESLARAWIADALGRRDVEGAARRYLAPDFRAHPLDTRSPAPDVPSFVASLLELHRAIPDARVEVEECFASGNRIAMRYRIDGTHRGTLLGKPGTGRPVTLTVVAFFRSKGERLAEAWTMWDVAGVERQLDGEGTGLPTLVFSH